MDNFFNQPNIHLGQCIFIYHTHLNVSMIFIFQDYHCIHTILSSCNAACLFLKSLNLKLIKYHKAIKSFLISVLFYNLNVYYRNRKRILVYLIRESRSTKCIVFVCTIKYFFTNMNLNWSNWRLVDHLVKANSTIIISAYFP